MNVPAQQQLVTELARDLAAAVAPHELRLFQTQREAYLENPIKVLKCHVGIEGMSDAGTVQTVIYLMPIVHEVLTDVVSFVAGEIQKTATVDNAHLLHDAIQQAFNSFRPDKKKDAGEYNPPLLTSIQLAQVRQMTLEKAHHYNLSKTKSQLLADSVVKSLAAAH